MTTAIELMGKTFDEYKENDEQFNVVFASLAWAAWRGEFLRQNGKTKIKWFNVESCRFGS